MDALVPGRRRHHWPFNMTKHDDLPDFIRKIIDESSALTDAWVTSHADEISDCDAQDVVFAQLHHAARRDSEGMERPYCVHCGRMRLLEIAAVKLWLEVQQLRGERLS